MILAKSMARFGLLVAAVVASSVPESRGVTIDFQGSGVAANGVLSPVPLPYLEDGFRIRNGTSGSQNGITGALNDAYPNSGSDFFSWVYGTSVVLEEASGALFSLQSFNAGYTLAASGPANSQLGVMQLTGHLDGGGTILASFKYGDPWANYNLTAAWTNLTSVEFAASNNADGALDNIVVNVVSKPVPDSGGTSVLMLLGAFALGVMKLIQVRATLRMQPVRK